MDSQTKEKLKLKAGARRGAVGFKLSFSDFSLQQLPK